MTSLRRLLLAMIYFSLDKFLNEASINRLFTGGYMKSSGVMYLKFKENFKQSAVATAWVFSLYTTFLLMLGIVSLKCSSLYHITNNSRTSMTFVYYKVCPTDTKTTVNVNGAVTVAYMK